MCRACGRWPCSSTTDANLIRRESREDIDMREGLGGEGMRDGRIDARRAHLTLLRGGKARTAPASPPAFAYPRSASLVYDVTSDARTRERVCEALRHNDLVDASGIDVYVANGEATLIA